MKRLTYSIFAFFLVARVGLAQPVARIPADIFLEAISTHPDIRAHAEQIGLMGTTTDSGRKGKRHIRHAEAQRNMAVAEHVAFVYEFTKNALLLYQQCWMLEQQMLENDEYRSDILSIRIIETRLLLKQQLMVRESDREKSDLEVKYANAVNTLNDLTRHVFGEQPILPENCVLFFETDEQIQDYSGEDNIMSESVADLTEKIAAQERLVFVRSSSAEAVLLMEQFYQLHIYKTQRWQARESIAIQEAEWFAGEEFLFVDQTSENQQTFGAD